MDKLRAAIRSAEAEMENDDEEGDEIDDDESDISMEEEQPKARKRIVAVIKFDEKIVKRRMASQAREAFL